MRQFDVFRNPSRRPNNGVPYVIILQSDAVSGTTAVVAASLIPAGGSERPERLAPIFVVEGRRLALAITDIASIPKTAFGEPVANLEAERSRIIAALDLLFTGV